MSMQNISDFVMSFEGIKMPYRIPKYAMSALPFCKPDIIELDTMKAMF